MPDCQYHTLSSQLIHYFGQAALLFQEGKVFEIVGVFDQASLETLAIENCQALFTVASQDLPSNLHGSLLQLNAKHYQIVQVQADGMGAVALVLSDTT